ncbi:MAG: hypothetical protein IPH18_17240 [Chitinophagaceae bacterium]|nr:hypothetical protein [Chitinophagaceae bacterium]MBK8952211.1 hypothetical protein [Chitinophagaceae bacterium]
MTLQVDILNPKAKKLLKELAALKLISIKETGANDFVRTVRKIRTKAASNPPSLKEITKEVEKVRAKRYAR